MRIRTLLSIFSAIAFLGACSDDDPAVAAPPSSWQVLISPNAPGAVRIAADDVARYFGEMGLSANVIETTETSSCENSVARVVFVGDGLTSVNSVTLTETENAVDRTQVYRVSETQCESGREIRLSGGGLLGRQYAAYEYLHTLGVRFFHPEEEFVPAAPPWAEWSDDAPLAPVEFERSPAFRYRSVSLHLTHPLELGDAFRVGNEAYFDEAKRFIDWQIKNLASRGSRGIGPGADANYGVMRGFPVESGFRLYGAQQGDTSILDPDDPRPDTEQILEAINERMNVENPPQVFSVGFDPSEFLEANDRDVVRQLSFVADTFEERYPDTILMTTNHGTAGAPTENYGVRYYDLPQFTPGNLGVKVHTLMFYDLFRPAPVYGNDDFHNLRQFMEMENENRRLWHFPEAAWWLTFDIALPLYLPITIEARDRDIQGLRHLLASERVPQEAPGLDGHHVFGTGHEWGYWQNEYCSFRMAANLDYRWTDCVRDIASPAGQAAEVLAQAILDAAVFQELDMFNAEILAYVVGTDPETETAASLGIDFHPLPPAPIAMLSWSDTELDHFDEAIAPRLMAMETEYGRLVATMDEVRDQVPVAAESVFNEVYDGLDAFRLRAKHQRLAYSSVVLLARSIATGNDTQRMEAEAMLAEAEAATAEVIQVVRRRESGYRYAPLSRSIAGGPEGNEDNNWTIYNYRYLNRTHHAYYFTRIDTLVREAFEGSLDPVAIEDALLGPEQALSLAIRIEDFDSASVDFGDGTTEPGAASMSHNYTTPGVYEVVVTTVGEETTEHRFTVAVTTWEHFSGVGAKVLQPDGASIIEEVTPGLVIGPIDETRRAIGFATGDNGFVSTEFLFIAEANAEVEGARHFTTRAVDAVLPVVNRATATVQTRFPITGAIVSQAEPAGVINVQGDVATDDVVAAVVEVGGFEENGARSILASLLGYTPDTLPVTLLFELEFGRAE